MYHDDWMVKLMFFFDVPFLALWDFVYSILAVVPDTFWEEDCCLHWHHSKCVCVCDLMSKCVFVFLRQALSSHILSSVPLSFLTVGSTLHDPDSLR